MYERSPAASAIPLSRDRWTTNQRGFAERDAWFERLER